MDHDAGLVADLLLRHDAVKIKTSGEPFVFSSGWASPVFIDLKRMISFPDARNIIMEKTYDHIERIFNQKKPDMIVGCELAGVPFASLVADRFHLPLIVALKTRRGFGRLAQFEGYFPLNAKALLVDDLTTDGATKTKMAQGLQIAQAELLDIFVIFAYETFPQTATVKRLLNLHDIVNFARAENRLPPHELSILEDFLRDAPSWSARHGGIG